MTSTIHELRALGLAELEATYAAERHFAIPEGRFRGQVLARLDSAGAHRPMSRMIIGGFRAVGFGVDFTSCRWYFVHPRLQAGRFRPEVHASRWRDTQVIGLHYQDSRLPGPIRAALYDEVKPLGDSICLGIGGLNAERGEGDLFFFALEREA